MSNLLPVPGLKLNYRAPSPASSVRPTSLDIQDGYAIPLGSGAITPHELLLSCDFRVGENGEVTAVPYAKLLPLCLTRIAEGMIFAIIMPYINEMILSFGVDENDVGIWSSIAASPSSS